MTIPSNPAKAQAVAVPGLNTGTVCLMAAAAAVATSTSYVLHPELTTVAADVHASVSMVTVAAGAAMLGYLLGLVLLVPLVDRWRANRLVTGQLAGLAASLVLAATAPNPELLAVAMLASGACASTGAQLSSWPAHTRFLSDAALRSARSPPAFPRAFCWVGSPAARSPTRSAGGPWS